MSTWMYTVSVPIFIQLLNALSAVLEKGRAYADERKIDHSFLLNMRLYPDMYSLIRQIQQATSHAAKYSAAIAGATPLPLPNTETTFAELQIRIAKTVDYLKTLKPEQFEDSADRIVTVGERSMPGRILLLTFVFPHFYFHCTTAYDILRHCGVRLIKHDFIGKPAEI